MWLGAQLWRLAFPHWVVAPPPPSVLWCSWLLESSTGQGSATDHYLALRPWGSGRGHKQQALICVLADCTSNVQQCANKNKLLGALAAAPAGQDWSQCGWIELVLSPIKQTVCANATRKLWFGALGSTVANAVLPFAVTFSQSLLALETQPNVDSCANTHALLFGPS